MIIVENSICKIFIKSDLKESDLIYSTTSTMYVKKVYNQTQTNKYLINYWPFNGNYFDTISNISLFNSINNSLVTDRYGRANYSLYLNNGYVQAPNGYYIYGDFTLTTWVKMKTLVAYKRFFRLTQLNGTVAYFSLSHNYTTKYAPYFSYFNGDQIANTSLTIGKWQHLAFTIKQTTISIYIDGLCVYQGMSLPIQTQYFKNVYIGYNGSPDAELDDIKIYNISLTQAEIIQSSFTNL